MYIVQIVVAGSVWNYINNGQGYLHLLFFLMPPLGKLLFQRLFIYKFVDYTCTSKLKVGILLRDLLIHMDTILGKSKENVERVKNGKFNALDFSA